MTDSVMKDIVWATAITLVLVFLTLSVTYNNVQFFHNNYCEVIGQTALSGNVKLIQKCDRP